MPPTTTATTPTPTPPINQATASSNRVPLSIPQLFQLVEKRIISLEERFKETNTNANNGNNNITEDILKDVATRINDHEQKIIEEYESRFEILATQLNDLKEVVLKLQMYTMDVNKVLLENQTVLTTNDVLETIQENIGSSVEVNDNES
uniref:Uncharacterized protein n=1 Tax=viral metagenome TaxID=1070528 RepID=A0A6C0CML4_9ZZZZ